MAGNVVSTWLVDFEVCCPAASNFYKDPASHGPGCCDLNALPEDALYCCATGFHFDMNSKECIETCPCEGCCADFNCCD